jgi:hypothetical protein
VSRRSGAFSSTMGKIRCMDTRVASAPLLGRLLLLGVVALGLVGMHHLVAVGCAQLGITSSSHASHGQPAVVATHVTPPAPGSVVSVSVAPTPLGAQLGPMPMSGGVADAVAACIAVLLLALLLRFPGVTAAWQRIFSRWRTLRTITAGRTLEPPNLRQLSISRT